eukprot:3777967-Heterocapsa_arctica.AAC.1
MGLVSSPSSPAASAKLFTSSSASPTLLSASLMVACIFRSAVDFFSSLRIREWASVAIASAASCHLAGLSAMSRPILAKNAPSPSFASSSSFLCVACVARVPLVAYAAPTTA